MNKSHLSGAVCAFLLLSITTATGAETIYVGSVFDPDFEDGRIEAVRTDGTGQQVLREVGGGLRGIAVDSAGGKLYWSDVDTDRIEQVLLDNTNGIPTGIIGDALSFVQSIALSETTEKLFWADQLLPPNEQGTNFESSNFDGSDRTVIRSALDSSTAIGVDDVNQKIYSESRSTDALGSIVRSNFDGSGLETVISDIPTATGIAIDPVHEYIFWTSSAGILATGDGGVYRVNFDGSDFQELFVMGSNRDTSGIVVDPFSEYVYWGQETSVVDRYDIYRMKLDGSSPEEISTGYGNITQMTFGPTLPANFITIDIKPSKKTGVNIIDLKKDKKLEVVVVGSTDFDALQVDPGTVKFGPNKQRPKRSKTKDYNRDGFSDQVLTFQPNETGIACGDTSAILIGKTYGGVEVQGSDIFTVTPCP